MGEVKKIQVEAKHGRKQNQKMKPYVVLQFLMKETDENHLVTTYDIAGYLEACGIDAERRSIYKDIGIHGSLRNVYYSWTAGGWAWCGTPCPLRELL